MSQLHTRQKIFIAAGIGFAVFLSWIIWSANRGQPNPFFTLGRQFPFGDTIGHFVLFAILTFFVNGALGHRTVTIGRWTPKMGALGVSVFIVLEEGSQYWIPNRTLDFWDLFWSLAGVLSVSWIGKREESGVETGEDLS